MVDVIWTAAANMSAPDRKVACLEQARIFREKAEADPVNRERWVDEAIKWLERAVVPSGQVVVTIDEARGVPEQNG